MGGGEDCNYNYIIEIGFLFCNDGCFFYYCEKIFLKENKLRLCLLIN